MPTTAEQQQAEATAQAVLRSPVLRVVPLPAQRPPTNESIIVLAITGALSFLAAVIVMVGANTAHRYLPAVPPLGYWDSWWILLTLSVLSQITIGRLQWKWARR